MSLSQLAKTLESSFWDSTCVVCFRDEQNPSRFIHAWRRAVQSRLGFSLQSLEHDGKSLPPELLQQSLFAATSAYWLGELSSKSTALLSYRGPCRLAFFVAAEAKISLPAHVTAIALPTIATTVQLDAAIELLALSLTPERRGLVASYLPLTLDKLLFIIDHVALVSGPSLSFFPAYLSRIMGDESNLYQLTDYFLARNAKAFYTLWDKLGHTYEPPFWTVFFGRTLWRVAEFLVAGASNQSVGRGLPFSFLKSGYKKYTQHDIAKRFNAIYHLDVACKSGSSAGQLEKFFAEHFE